MLFNLRNQWMIATLALLALAASPRAGATETGNCEIVMLVMDSQEMLRELDRRNGDPSSLIQNWTQADRVRLARAAAAQDGAKLSRTISLYQIDPDTTDNEGNGSLFGVFKIAARQNPDGTTRNLDHYGFRTREEIKTAIRFLAGLRGAPVSRHLRLSEIALLTEADRIELAEYIAEREDFSSAIQYAGISEEKDRIRIIQITAHVPGNRVAVNFHLTGIVDQAAKIRIARILATQANSHFLANVQNLGIEDQNERIQLALIAAQHRGADTLQHLNHFQISDPNVIEQIIEAALRSSSSEPLTFEYRLRDLIQPLRLPQNNLRSLIAHNLHLDPLNALTLLTGIEAPISHDALKPYLTQLSERAPDILPPEYVRLLWDETKGYEPALRILAQALRLHQRGVPAPNSSRELLAIACGISNPAFLTTRYSSSATHYLYGALLELQGRLREPAFAGIELPNEFFTDKKLSRFISLLTALRDLHGLRGSNQQAWNEIGSMPLDVETLRQESVREIAARFEAYGLRVDEQSFARLQARWSNLDAIYTLIARYQGHAPWQNELPLLGEIFEAVLENRFERYKFESPAALQQLTSLHTEQARLAWRRSRANAAYVASSGAVVVSAILNDARSLLEIGELIPLTSSCMNVHNGIHIQALPAYVRDANILGVASFALQKENFSSLADYQSVRDALQTSALSSERIHFDGDRRRFVFDVPSAAQPISSLSIAQAYRRNIIRLGTTDSDLPAILVERPYSQDHSTADLMDQQRNTLVRDIAREIGAVFEQPATYPASLNPGGVNSDYLRGLHDAIMHGPYRISPRSSRD